MVSRDLSRYHEALIRKTLELPCRSPGQSNTEKALRIDRVAMVGQNNWTVFRSL